MIRLAHHHLRKGGVSQVMLSAARGLLAAGEQVEFLLGESPALPLPEEAGCRVIPGLGYENEQSPTNAEDLLTELLRGSADGDIWHVHNHALGKNPAVTDAWVRLAEAGKRVVLQPHDFAEDGRPANLARLRESLPGFPRRMYPVGDHIRYAVLQTRDRDILRTAGVPDAGVRVFPNPVSVPADLPPPRDPPRRILYLTRAIRRKNIGEFLAWAQAFGNEVEFATSLTPENPAERTGFLQWRDWVEVRGIPVRWGVGEEQGRSFKDVVSSADACITTSVGEGFGMSFLEPFAMGRRILGRDLPEITAGFREEGVRFEQLYTRMPVPADSVDPDFWTRALERVEHWLRGMGAKRGITVTELKQAWCQDNSIDFGRLDETAQRHVLSRITLSAADYRHFLNSSPRTVETNRALIRSRYAVESYVERLQELYAGLSEGTHTDYANGTAVRDAFLDPQRTWLLRS